MLSHRYQSPDQRTVSVEPALAPNRLPLALAVTASLLSLAAGCTKAAPAPDSKAPAAARSREARDAPAVIRVDAARDRHPISPLIYGANFASPEQARLLNLPVNRIGGNAMTRYNWELNATSSGSDWFFLSHAEKGLEPGGEVDDFVAGNQHSGVAAGTQSMVTIPLIGWAAKLGPNRSNLWSFSVAKYGPQKAAEQYNHDMGNGLRPDGTPITGNDPNDANEPVDVNFERRWMNHLVGRFGRAANGGIPYYLLDNEPGLWQDTHRDVLPVGVKMQELYNREQATASMIKSVDPTALVGGPEAWGWNEYIYSAYDAQWAKLNGYGKPRPDRTAHSDVDQAPWLLQQFAAEEKRTGKRLLDLLTFHYYPQAEKVSSPDASDTTQILRNRSTRSLWDPYYVDESWIHNKIRLIPRMKEWVRANYPGTKIGVTEYDFGAENNIGGATAEADVLGIFGREGIDLATRWVCPKVGSPVFNSMMLYRNYDGRNGTFGDTSVACHVPDPDRIAAFASQNHRSGIVKVMLINKQIHDAAPVTVSIAHARLSRMAAAYRLDSANRIRMIGGILVGRSSMAMTLPAQSITLLVIPAAWR